jgi:putative Holliday junction resolvase
MRYLAIDLGDKRTGVACGDDILRIPSPVEVIEASSTEVLIARLEKAAREYGPDALVVGLPLNMDGSEGPRAKAAREIAEACAAKLGIPAHMQDERLTSFAAEQSLNRSGRTRGQKKRIRDALAACELLTDYFRRGV